MIFWLLMGIVVLAPLPFASVHAWSSGLMATGTGALLVAWSAQVAFGKVRPAFGLGSTWLLVILFLAPAGWAIIQTLPLTPEAWHHPLWRNAREVLAADLPGSVSLNSDAGIFSVARLLAYGGIFWLSLNYGRDPTHARQVILCVTVAGAIYALYGLIVEFSGARTILWFDKFAYQNDLTSTFINRNSYATYAGLTLLCASALLLNMLSKSLASSTSRKEQTLRLIESMTGSGWMYMLIWVVLITALILTHSRGGFLSTILALAVLVVALNLKGTVNLRQAMTFAAVPLLAIVVFFTISGEVLDKRLAQAVTQQGERPLVYALTMEAIETAPLLGTGYGSFEEVFRFYRRDDIGSFYVRAHNTYLENGLELGLPAALSLFGVFAGFLYLTFNGLRRRRQGTIYPAIGFAATILVAAHSMVDFSLQIPAVAATYALIMGTACAQSWRSNKPRDSW